MIIFRNCELDEIEKISKLIDNSFSKFISSGYSEAGIIEFQKYISPEAIRTRFNNNHFMIIAEIDNQIVGVIEIRSYNHISLLFVNDRFHGQGIAKELWNISKDRCKEFNQDQKYTVNSSKYAATIYNKLGFIQSGEYQVKNGIGFIPMSYSK